MTSVSAVVLGPVPGEAPRLTLEGLEGQARAPDRVVVAREPGAPHAALRAALEDGSTWLWLLDATVRPEPRALEQLLAVVEDLGELPSPVLLSSKVVTPDGALDPRSAPTPDVLRRELAVAAVRRRLLALRVASRGSLLVHRRGFEARGLPRAAPPSYDDREWTARLLKDEAGLLVPASVVVRAAADGAGEGRRTRMELASEARLVLGDALESEEVPWFAFRLAERAASAGSGRARALTARALAAARRGRRA